MALLVLPQESLFAKVSIAYHVVSINQMRKLTGVLSFCFMKIHIKMNCKVLGGWHSLNYEASIKLQCDLIKHIKTVTENPN